MFYNRVLRVFVEDPIVEFCREAQGFDEIMERFDYAPLELQKRLVGLQLSGMIEQDFMGRWVRRT